LSMYLISLAVTQLSPSAADAKSSVKTQKESQRDATA
jgi:hypothetical protein